MRATVAFPSLLFKTVNPLGMNGIDDLLTTYFASIGADPLRCCVKLAYVFLYVFCFWLRQYTI